LLEQRHAVRDRAVQRRDRAVQRRDSVGPARHWLLDLGAELVVAQHTRSRAARRDPAVRIRP
jgi:hypothetical protein